MSLRLPLAPALVALAALSCGSEPSPHAAGRPSLLGAQLRQTEAFPSPAVWKYQPREAAQLGVKVTLPDGGTLFAGQRGERFLVAPHAEVAEVAADSAPEELVAILQPPSGGFLFVGRSGTSYETRTPLGQFVRSNAPLSPLVRVRAQGTVLVGVRRDGAIVRSDSAGAAWTRVGPEAEHFADVALAPDGKGLALAVPEAYFATEDSARTFTRVDAKTNGATALTVDETAGIVALTARGPLAWKPGPGGGFSPVTNRLAPASQTLGASLPVGPSAAALESGRAVVIGDRWIEVRPGADATYRLVKGTFGAPLAATPFPVARGCTDVHLAGNEHALYLACARQKTPTVSQSIEIHRSDDGGTTFHVDPYVVEGRTAELEMTVTADGSLLVSGVCSAELRGPGCRPTGVHRRESVPTDSGTGLALVPVATPSLTGTALGLVASYDGRVVFALGRRSKSEALAVFVSRDGGGSFEARDTPLTVPEDDRARGQVAIESVSAAEDGTVSFVVSNGGKRSWLVVDDDGRTLAVAKPPVAGARIAAAGTRGLVVDAALREAWESLDGGATFTSLGRLPVDLGAGTGDPSPRLACVARGCVVGDVLARIGWRGAPRATLLSPPEAEHAPQRVEQRVGATLACTLDPGEWRKIQGSVGPPFAEQAAIGRYAWFTLKQDADTASVTVVRARRGRDGAIEELALLPPAKQAETMAYAASIQIEGVAAIRYRTLDGRKGHDPNLRDIEVAWDDLLFGRTGHAVIPDGGPFRPNDYGDRSNGQLASAALVSIASGGVYVRVHASLDENQPTFFVDGKTVEVVPPVAWSTAASAKAFFMGVTSDARGRPEMARVGRAHVPLRLDGTTVRRAHPTDHGWRDDAIALGYADPRSFGRTQEVAIAYVGEAAGLHVESDEISGRGHSGLIYPFRVDGAVVDPPVAVPTQLDLPAVPRPCGNADQTATPRVVAPFRAGTRHPVIVSDPVEPQRVLLTEDAVLHGTPTSPCAVAYEAVLISSEAMTTAGVIEQGIVFVDPGERSWLFRATRATKEGPPPLEYRAMSCRVDPGAEVPVEVFREKGTLVEPAR